MYALYFLRRKHILAANFTALAIRTLFGTHETNKLCLGTAGLVFEYPQLRGREVPPLRFSDASILLELTSINKLKRYTWAKREGP